MLVIRVMAVVGAGAGGGAGGGDAHYSSQLADKEAPGAPPPPPPPSCALSRCLVVTLLTSQHRHRDLGLGYYELTDDIT